MTTITIPCPRAMRADDAAYALNRAINADDDFLIGIFDAFCDPDIADPAIADLLSILRRDFHTFRLFCLDLDICPIHETDIDSCLDDSLSCTRNDFRR